VLIAICTSIYTWESGSERVKERVRVKARESLSFPPTAYPPPLLDGVAVRERERERGGREKKRKNERKKWQE